MKYTRRVASSLQCVSWGHTTITTWGFWRPFLYCYDCIMQCNIGLHKLFLFVFFLFVGLSFCSTYLYNHTIHLEISYSVFHSKFVITNDSLSVILILYEDCASVAAWRSSDIQQSTCFAQPNSHEANGGVRHLQVGGNPSQSNTSSIVFMTIHHSWGKQNYCNVLL